MLDSAIDLINSTVQLEQSAGNGERIVGTGFLLSASDEDGSPRTILITANHVFRDMKAPEIRIGFRSTTADGTWTYTPGTLQIRDDAGAPLWTRHPDRDVAAITMKAPPEYARAAIPISYLAADGAAKAGLEPGDELLVLGYPRGLSSNEAGFPILRAGRIASYPVSPQASPTFLLDFSVFPGNSGGPVFATKGLQRASAGPSRPLIAGILTQQVEVNREPLEIGIVTHAQYIAETVDILYGGRRPSSPAAEKVAQQEDPPAAAAQPVAHRTAPTSFAQRMAAALRAEFAPIRLAAARVARGFAGWLLAWAGPAPTDPSAAEGLRRI